MASEIPQSQKNRIRLLASKAWRLTAGDSSTAKVLAGRQIEREVGGKWVIAGNQLAEDLIDYWEENGVCEPAAVFVAGEPAMQQWDE